MRLYALFFLLAGALATGWAIEHRGVRAIDDTRDGVRALDRGGLTLAILEDGQQTTEETGEKPGG